MNEIIFGRNPVIEALKSDLPVNKLFIQKADAGNVYNKDIASLAKAKGIPVEYVNKNILSAKSEDGRHQGAVAEISPFAYVEIEDILEVAKEKNENPMILVADHLEDPHNLGAIIRSAEAFGVHGIILPKKRSVSLTAVVAKASAGAIMHMPVARTANLVQALESLKEKGLWVVGMDMDGDNIFQAGKSLKGPIAVVVGSEGKGMSSLVKKNCDFVVSIPMKGKINSFNASVAASIVLYEVTRQRNF